MRFLSFRRTVAILIAIVPVFVILAFRGDVASSSTASFFAPTISATNNDALVVDVDGDGRVDPGDTIEYSVTIQNTQVAGAGNDATGVSFSETLSANTTLVGGSLVASPVSVADSYAVTGNIQAVPGTSVLANDIDPTTGAAVAGATVAKVNGLAANVGAATSTTATGIGGVSGQVTMAAGGTFSYEPPPGFTGNDTFTYNATKNGVEGAATTVTIAISGMVWFIDNTSVAANSRGTFTQPFKTIAAFNAVNSGTAPNPQDSQFVVLRGSSYNEADGINLRSGQVLIGPATQFSGVFTASANSAPAYNSFAAGTGAAATINATAGNGIDLNTNNTVRGLNVGNTPGFFKLNGGAVGSPTLNTISLTGTGGAINVSTSGSFGSNVTFGTLESTSSPGANLNLVGVTGSIAMTSPGTGFGGSGAASNAVNISGGGIGFTYTGNVTKSSGTGAAVSIGGGHNGNITFGPGTVSASSGTGLQFDNADGLYTFSGTNTLGGGDAGIDVLNGSSGTFNFSPTSTITNPTGASFNVSTGSPIISFSGTITHNTAGQRAVNIDGTTGGSVIISTVTAGSTAGGVGNTGVNINNAAGSVSFTTLNLGVLANRMTAQAVTIAGGAGAKNLGTVNIFTTGAAQGIVSTATTGAIIIGSGNIDSNGAAAINIVGTSSASRTPLNIQLTSVTSTGGATGIIVSNTSTSGSPGGLNITGTGANNSGGTFTNNTDDAIRLTAVQNVNFDELNIQNPGGDGIDGRQVTNFTLTDSTVNGAGDNLEESSVAFNNNKVTDNNIAGTLTITGNAFTDQFYSGIDVQAGDGTITQATISNNVITNTTNGFGINFVGTCTNTSCLRVDNADLNQNNITNARGAGVQIQVSSNTTGTQVPHAGLPNDAAKRIDITNNSILPATNGTHAIAVVTGSANAGARAKMHFLVECNGKNSGGCTAPTANAIGSSLTGHVLLVGNNGYSDMVGTFNNNVVAATHTPSGSASNAISGGNGVSGVGNAFTPNLTLNVTNNVVSGTDGNGILLVGRGTSGTASLKITGNSVGAPLTGNRGGIRVDAGNASSADDSVCLNISSNTTMGSGVSPGINIRKEGSNGAVNDFGLQNWAAAATPNYDNAEDFVAANNPASELGTDADGGSNRALALAGDAYVGCNTAAFAGNSSELEPALRKAENASISDAWFELEPFIGAGDRPGPVTVTTLASAETLLSNEQLDSGTAMQGKIEGRIQVEETQEQDGIPLSTLSRLLEWISPTAHAQESPDGTTSGASPEFGETVAVNGSGSGFALPAQSSVTIKFRATAIPYVAGGAAYTSVSTQGSVTGTNFGAVATDDPASGGAADPTVTAIDHTTVAVATNGGTVSSGQSVTFTATLTGVPARSSDPPSTVQFKDGGVDLGSAAATIVGTLNDNVATAQFTTTTLSPGTHTITAEYSGGGTGALAYNPNTGTLAGGQTVTKGATTAGVTSSQNPALTGQPLTLTATVAVTAPASGSPTGSVTFKVGGNDVNGCVNVAIDGAFQATCSPTLAAGSHTVTAVYNGDANFDASGAGAMAANPQLITDTATWDGSTSSDWTEPTNWTTNYAPVSGTHSVSIPSAGVTNEPLFDDGSTVVGNLSLAPGRSLTIFNGATVGVTGLLTMSGGDIDATNGLLLLATTATVNRTSGAVLGDMEKVFGATGSFTFDLGTATGYSPAVVNVTALAVDPSSLKIRANDGTAAATPPRNDAQTLDRYWVVTEAGDLTADVTFNYLDADVDGNEANYRVLKIGDGGAVLPQLIVGCPTVGAFCIDPDANQIILRGASSFSTWTGGEVIATAAAVTVSGRVVDQRGKGINRVKLTLTDPSGESRIATTNSFGFYQFLDVPAGQTYFLFASAKRYTFEPSTMVVSVSDELTGVNFVGGR